VGEAEAQKLALWVGLTVPLMEGVPLLDALALPFPQATSSWTRGSPNAAAHDANQLWQSDAPPLSGVLVANAEGVTRALVLAVEEAEGLVEAVGGGAPAIKFLEGLAERLREARALGLAEGVTPAEKVEAAYRTEQPTAISAPAEALWEGVWDGIDAVGAGLREPEPVARERDAHAVGLGEREGGTDAVAQGLGECEAVAHGEELLVAEEVSDAVREAAPETVSAAVLERVPLAVGVRVDAPERVREPVELGEGAEDTESIAVFVALPVDVLAAEADGVHVSPPVRVALPVPVSGAVGVLVALPVAVREAAAERVPVAVGVPVTITDNTIIQTGIKNI